MLEPLDCDGWATPRSSLDGDGADVEVDAVDATEADNREWVRNFSPSPTVDLRYVCTNRSEKKVGFILTPTSQPRVYLVYSVHDVQGVPTRVEKGEDLNLSIVRPQN